MHGFPRTHRGQGGRKSVIAHHTAEHLSVGMREVQKARVGRQNRRAGSNLENLVARCDRNLRGAYFRISGGAYF